MRIELLYNPQLLLERLGVGATRALRMARLRKTCAEHLKLGEIESLELLELVRKETPSIQAVYDIGANVGTWSTLTRAIFPTVQIEAFEPLRGHATAFQDRFRSDARVRLHTVALGSQPGSAQMNVTQFSDASSLLAPTTHALEDRSHEVVGKEEVTIVRLDDYRREQALPYPDVIKLDIQGFELEALKGATECLRHARYVLSEVSFEAYYEGQPLFEEISQFLSEWGFRLHALRANTLCGQALTQTDVLFAKTQ